MSDIPDDLIAIDPAVASADEIMALVRARVAARRDLPGYEGRRFPELWGATMPTPPEDSEYDANLYHHLKLANEYYNAFPQGLVLPPSRATKMPVVGRLWSRLRHYLHNIIAFYTTRSSAHAARVDWHLVSVLNQLTKTVQAQQREIYQLRGELDVLKDRMESERD